MTTAIGFKQFLMARNVKAAALARDVNELPQTINAWFKRGIPPDKIRAVAKAVRCEPRELKPFASKPNALIETVAHTKGSRAVLDLAEAEDADPQQLAALLRWVADAVAKLK